MGCQKLRPKAALSAYMHLHRTEVLAVRLMYGVLDRTARASSHALSHRLCAQCLFWQLVQHQSLRIVPHSTRL